MAALIRSASLTHLSQAGMEDDDKFEKLPLKMPHRQKKKTIRHHVSTSSTSSRNSYNSYKKWTWLSKPTQSFHEKQPKNETQALHCLGSIPASQDLQEPTMTRHMEHLETLLPQYCRHLSHPTYQEAASAMSLLLNNPPYAPLATTSTTLPTSNEKTDSFNRLLSSPFRSQKPHRVKSVGAQDQSLQRPWSTSRSSSSLSQASPAISSHYSGKSMLSFHDKLQAAAWQSFVAPLVLLAGAEAVYADLEHVHPTPQIIAWTGLYQRLTKRLQAMLLSAAAAAAEDSNQNQPGYGLSRTEGPLAGDSMEALPTQPSTPSLSTTKDNTSSSSFPTSASTTGARDAKKASRTQLQSLVAWLDWKCQWLPFRESLFLTWSVDSLPGFQKFAKSLPLQHDTDVLMEALNHEVHATLVIMEMAFWLERGR
jgi:hypothetical protein